MRRMSSTNKDLSKSSKMQRKQLKSKIINAGIDTVMFLYVFSVVASGLITLPLVYAAGLACIFSFAGFLVSPIAAILKYFFFENILLPTRGFVIGLFVFCCIMTGIIIIHTYLTQPNVHLRNRVYHRKTESLCILCCLILYAESGFWMLSFLSWPARLVIFSICCHFFYGESVVFKDRVYATPTKIKLKNYFSQANSLPYLKIYEITNHFLAYY